MGQPFLELDRITKSFGGLKAVSDVSFRMARDEIIGLIGPNGAGKTTLLRLITGILKPDSGMITFKGKTIIGMKTWDIVNFGIASTFQNMRPFRRSADYCQRDGVLSVSQVHETGRMGQTN